MFNKKILFIFLLVNSLNIFGMNQSLSINKSISDNYIYFKQGNLDTINQQAPISNENITASVTQNNQSLNQNLQSKSLPENVVIKIIEAQHLPEIQLIENAYNKKDVNLEYINKLIVSLANKYKSLMIENLGTINIYSFLSPQELNNKIQSLEKDNKIISRAIKRYNYNISSLLEIYRAMSGWHLRKKPALLSDIVTANKNCAKAMAELSLNEDLLNYANTVIKEKNTQNLQKSEKLSNAIVKENSKKETLSSEETTYQEMALERTKVAKKICEQTLDAQCKDRKFDTSGISEDFLKNNGYNKEDVSNLKGANDLQDFLQKDFIKQIKENQNFKQQFGEKELLAPLIDLHDKCIKGGLEANKAGDTQKAMTFSDLCWKTAERIKTFAKTLENIGNVALETLHSLDKVTCEATKTFIDVADKLIRDFFKRPDEHIAQLVEGALDDLVDFTKITDKGLEAVLIKPIQTIKKLLKSSNMLANKATEVSAKCMDFCVESVNNPTTAKEKIRTLEDNVCKFLDNAGDSLSKANKLEITRTIGKFVSSGYAIGEALKFAETFAEIVTTEISEGFTKVLKEITEVKTTPSLVTTTSDGLTMPMDVIKETFNDGSKIIEITEDTLNSINTLEENKFIDQIIEKVEKEIKNDFQLIGQETTLRNVDYMHGIKHGINRHFFDKFGKYEKVALKHLDPNGNPEKWIHYIINLSQTGEGIIKTIETGEIIEIMGKMQIKNCEYIDLGVRMFKPLGSDTWMLTTILTKQIIKKI